MEFLEQLPIGIYLVIHNRYVNKSDSLWRAAKKMHFPDLNFIEWPAHDCDDKCCGLGLVLVESRDTILEMDVELDTMLDICESYNDAYNNVNKTSPCVMPIVDPLHSMSPLDIMAEVACNYPYITY